MSNINMSSIMRKVKEYSVSDVGKNRIAKFIKERRESGDSKLESGDYIVTEQDMIRAAEEMIRILQETASAKGLPESIKEHFYSLYYSQPTPYGGQGEHYKVDVKFGGDLSRMSLKITSGNRKGEFTGEGIQDIVSLFDTGYEASKKVYGSWGGHGDETIGSLTHREGLNFMAEAIDSFNRECGEIYHVFAYLSSENPGV